MTKAKRILWTCLGLLLFLVLSFGIAKPVQADVAYRIDRYQINANVQADGSLRLERELVYRFDDDANGVFYQQNLDRNQRLNDLNITIGNQKVKQASSGANNTYQVTTSEKGYRFKVFHHAKSGSKITIRYAYTITNAITSWADTAELNFKIVGDGWEVDLHNVSGTIRLPGQRVKTLRAWLHGPLSGQTQVDRNRGQVKFKVKTLPANTFIETHLLFDKTLTSDNPNLKSGKRLATVLAQEKKLAQQANAQRRRQQAWHRFWLISLTLIGAISAIFVLFFNFKPVSKKAYRPKAFRDVSHNFEVPQVPAGVAQSIYKADLPDTKALSAYLLELAAKKIIAISQVPIEKKTLFGKKRQSAKETYQLKILNHEVLDQEPMLDFLISRVGNGETLTMQALSDYGHSKTSNQQIKTVFESWQKHEYQQAVSAGYLDQAQKDQRTRQLIFSISGLILSSLALSLAVILMQRWAWLVGVTLVTILEMIAIFFKSRQLSPYTQKGAEMTTQLRGLHKMMADIGRFNLKEVGDIILWENLLPYAVMFGLAKKVISALKVQFPEVMSDPTFNSSVYAYLIFAGSDFDGFTNAFSTSFASGMSNYSSSSGSSGGFSGGSSGGFGGGSGGGAF